MTLDLPLAYLEPHAGLLKCPKDDQLLFKVMKAEYFVAGVRGSYLHFNRVDSYRDFPLADQADGEQLPGDRGGNAGTSFERNPDFTAAKYYDQSRSRTYAYCVSTENSPALWTDQAAGATRGKIGLTFHFGRLRALLNEIYMGTTIEVAGQSAKQVFSINYGLVEYVDRTTHRANGSKLPNPITYTYLKDVRYEEELELRVSLSAFGIGQYHAGDQVVVFPPSLQFPFPYKEAMARSAITAIEHSQDCDFDWLRAELAESAVELVDDSSGRARS
jgi:hypothetical protein